MSTWQTTSFDATTHYGEAIGIYGHTMTLTDEESGFIQTLPDGTVIRVHRRIEIVPDPHTCKNCNHPRTEHPGDGACTRDPNIRDCSCDRYTHPDSTKE